MNKVLGRTRDACLVFLACLLLCSCASTRKIDWNSRIGTYHYDQAVTELGPPDKSAVLSDNSQVAEWLVHRGGSFGSFYAFHGPWIQTYHEMDGPDSFLRLTFDAQGVLRSWKRVVK